MGSGVNVQPHIALMAFPFASHPGNLFALARMLADAAPDAAFSFFTSAQSVSALSQTPRPDNIRLYPVDDGCSEAAGPPVVRTVVERIGNFIKATPKNFRAGMEAAVNDMQGLKVSCAVTDAFLCMTGDMAEEMGVPWIPFWTCAPAALLAHIYTDDIRREIGAHEKDVEAMIPAMIENSIQGIPSLSSLRLRDLPLGVLPNGFQSDLGALLHRVGKELPSATAIAINTFQGLNPEIDHEFTSKFKNFLPIGPFNLLMQTNNNDAAADQRNECLKWLDRHGPATVAYIGFGTTMVPPKNELEELAHGVEASGVPFLWSLKDMAKKELPAGFLDRTKDRGLILPWAPQVQVLGHDAVGAFMTHCGWNSVMEAITTGVPMVCRPLIGDQVTVARMVSHVWKFGVVLDSGSVTKEEIVKTLNVVLREEEGRKMRKRACELKELAAHAARPDGKSRENFKALLKIVCGDKR